MELDAIAASRGKVIGGSEVAIRVAASEAVTKAVVVDSGAGGFPGGGGRGPGGGGVDKLTLASAKPIQEELKLGEDELFFVAQLTEDFRADSRELYSGIDWRSLSEEDRKTEV